MSFKHRTPKVLVSLAASGGVIAIMAAPASAGPGGTQGPGTCGIPPGPFLKPQPLGAPNAGPNGQTRWATAPGAPNAPGQAVVNVCGLGHRRL